MQINVGCLLLIVEGGDEVVSSRNHFLTAIALVVYSGGVPTANCRMKDVKI